MNYRLYGSFAAATLGAATLLVGCHSADTNIQDATKTYSAEIRRTSFGVPHIKATNEKGLGYGTGYVYAQDNFCLMADALVTNAGERSKYFGPDSTYSVYGAPNDALGNLASDFYYKYLNDPAQVQAAWDSQPAEIQDLVTGYVAGYNRFLAETGKSKLPDACKDQSWVREMTTQDMMRLARRYAVMQSGGALINAFYAAGTGSPALAMAKQQSPKQAAASDRAQRLAMVNLKTQFASNNSVAPWGKLKSDLGSNGVALGKDATESGRGLLFANPHFPWGSITRFYQMHLTIPGKIDVMGASLGGLPVVTIGFNNDVAWTHTVNEAPRFALFMVMRDPADSTRYMMDGVSKAMTKREISVETITGGVKSTAKRTFYFTEHGPLVAVPSLAFAGDLAVADVNFDNNRMLKQWWSLGQAKTLAEMKVSLETIVGTPWVNTIATDKNGGAYYGDINPVPNVSDAKESACVPAPLKFLEKNENPLYIIAGSVSACLLGNDPAAPQKGIYAGAAMPSLMRSDYVQNSNDSPWLSNPKQRLVGFPGIVSNDSTVQHGRTRLGLAQIADRLEGKDGLAGNKFSVKSLQDIAFSNEAYFGRLLLADLRAACANPPVDIAKGCTILSNWDGRANQDSVGWPLFQQWLAVMDGSKVTYWTVPFDPSDPVNTPRGLRVSDPSVKSAALAAMATAMQQLDSVGIDYTKPWGTLLQVAQGAKRVPIHGGSGGASWVGGADYAEQIYNMQWTKPRGDGTLAPYWGSSIVLTVSFEGATPKAQGFLTSSQSSDPKSPYAVDQTERYSRKEWITFPFTDAEIANDPSFKSVKLSE